MHSALSVTLASYAPEIKQRRRGVVPGGFALPDPSIRSDARL